MTLKPGTQLGQYEVLNLIGQGGMGEVYRAHDSKLGRWWSSAFVLLATSCCTLQAQISQSLIPSEVTVSGIVVDSDGSPIPGAAIEHSVERAGHGRAVFKRGVPAA